MARDAHITQSDLSEIRSVLSNELAKMKPAQRKQYLEAAKDVYAGLSRMAKIRELVKA